MVDPAAVTLPPQAEPSGRPAWHERLIADNGSDLATEADRRRVIATYYGMIAYANDQMQRLYDAMARLNMLENTWIVLTSDHGDYTGEHNAFAKSESLYECLLHVPLIIRPPDHVAMKRGMMVDGLVDLTDVFSTVLAIAGIEPPDYVQGHDLMAWLADGARTPLRDCVFAQVGEYHGHLKTTWPGGLPESGRHPSLLQGARDTRFAYVRDPDYGDEAYDLRHDPFELRNLLNPGQPPPPREVDQMRRRVDEWEAHCLDLRAELGIKPGDRGFWDGIQHQVPQSTSKETR
jgi:arylsulfatase A-like enzyme